MDAASYSSSTLTCHRLCHGLWFWQVLSTWYGTSSVEDARIMPQAGAESEPVCRLSSQRVPIGTSM
jgi:hypothetical protein